MADYIDREELLKEFELYGNQSPVALSFIDETKDAPSVDAVEVVRCKDCINYGMKCCQKDKYFVSVKEDDFCSRGVKKNEGNN